MRALRLVTFLSAVASGAAFAACASDAPTTTGPRASCTHVAWIRLDTGTPVVRPSWDAFRAQPMRAVGDGWFAASLTPPAGAQTYAIEVGGTFVVDPTVATTAYATIDGAAREVTWLDVASCASPALRFDQVTPKADAFSAQATFVAAEDGAALASATATLDGAPLAVRVEGATLSLSSACALGRHRLVLEATDAAGRTTRSERSFLASAPFAWKDAVIYQVMVDRFRGADGLALPALATPSARAGGHLDGVRRALPELVAMGVNTVWISPVYAAPAGTFPGRDGRPYSGYHGYWPISARTVEPTYGGEAALDALVSAAHAASVRVVLDVVPNHVHEQHPYFKAHPTWFDKEACLCGDAACPWNAGLLPCRFAPYLPDVEFRDPAAFDAMVDDVRWAVDRFALDGVRIDAVPQMPRAASRRIVHALARLDPTALTLGETFVGPGGYPGLRHFLGPGGLASEFEFPLMWALRATFADGSATVQDLGKAVEASRDALADTGAVMSLMIGNHDVPRFASVVVGDGGRDGFSPAPQPTDPDVYLRTGLAFGLVFALPGMPTIYYGDEIGLAGGGDPDTRRPMPAEASWLEPQRALRTRVARMAKVRACSPALRDGDVRVIASDAERLVVARKAGGRTVLAVVTRDDRAKLEGPLPADVAPGTWVDLLSGQKKVLGARAVWDEPARTVRYYAPDGDPCAAGASGV
ncbi:MAG: hypothetical protein JNL79_09250 [Myxococcales bacterium]|nr:hypothetical protein [Myxococcales bacterium]